MSLKRSLHCVCHVGPALAALPFQVDAIGQLFVMDHNAYASLQEQALHYSMAICVDATAKLTLKLKLVFTVKRMQPEARHFISTFVSA